MEDLSLAAEPELVRLAVLIHHRRVGHDQASGAVCERQGEAQIKANTDDRPERTDGRGVS